MITGGAPFGTLLSFSRTRKPLLRGIIMSTITRSGDLRSATANPMLPSPAVSTR